MRHHVAGPQPEQRRQPGHEFLRPDGRQHRGRGQARDAEAPGQELRDRRANCRRAGGQRVAGCVGRPGERFLHDLRRRVDRGADGQVDQPRRPSRRDGTFLGRVEPVPGEVGEVRRPHSSCSCGGSAATCAWSRSDQSELRGTAGRAEVVEELDVRLVVLGPLLRDVVLVVDGLDGADRLAGAAVDALVGVDVEHPLALVDAVDRTLLYAGFVLEVDAGLKAITYVTEGPPRDLTADLVSRSGHAKTTTGAPLAATIRPRVDDLAGRRRLPEGFGQASTGRRGDDRRGRTVAPVVGRNAGRRTPRRDPHRDRRGLGGGRQGGPAAAGPDVRRPGAGARTAADRGPGQPRRRTRRSWAAGYCAPPGGWTLRANSVLVLDAPGLPVPEALAVVDRWYRERDLAPAFSIPEPLDDGLGAALTDLGWPTTWSGGSWC